MKLGMFSDRAKTLAILMPKYFSKLLWHSGLDTDLNQ